MQPRRATQLRVVSLIPPLLVELCGGSWQVEAPVDAVDLELARYPQSRIVRDVLGTLDAAEIRARARSLEPELEEIFVFRASVGALFGIRRRDGTRLALK